MELLDHDTSAYAEVFEQITLISKAWSTSRAAMLAQREPLERIWRDLRDAPGHALPRVMVAHLLADLQEDPHEELAWDLRSLRALAPIWEQVADPRLFDVGRRCLPSIYLSLAGASRRCGDIPAAREYLARSRALAVVLPPGAYHDGLTGEIAKLQRALDRAPARTTAAGTQEA
jgi:hypothetical protein